MGIFSKKNDTTDNAVTTQETVTPVVHSVVPPSRLDFVIRKPRITEKAARLSDMNVYTFEVAANATKYDVRQAIKVLYNVTPRKIHIVNKVARQYMSRSRGRKLMEHGLRKAYVYLKKDDRIELV